MGLLCDRSDYVGSVLCAAIDRSMLLDACGHGRAADRVYYYQMLLKSACAKCFRWYNSDDGVSVYAFDGVVGIWFPVSDSVLKSALRIVFDELVGGEFPIVRSDLVNNEGKLLSWMRDGAMSSPLELSASIVGFRNCVVDFSDIFNPVVHGLCDGMPVVRLLDYDYDVGADCVVWKDFLRSILPAADILTLQKYLGLGCVDRLGMSHKIEETLWLVGNGANGKSTIRNVVEDVFGSWNIEDLGMNYLVSPAGDSLLRVMSRLDRKIFNYASEMQSFDIKRGIDTFKSLCSGEPQIARRLRNDVRKIEHIPFFIFNTNTMPEVPDGDAAFWRRLVKIRFRTSVMDGDMDRELGMKLRQELSGIRNWCIEGFKRLVKDGYKFQDAKKVRESRLEDMADVGDTASVFCVRRKMRANRRSGHWDEKPQYVRASQMYDEYCDFCRGEDYVPMDLRQFGRAIKRMGYERKRKASGNYYEVFSDDRLDFAISY